MTLTIRGVTLRSVLAPMARPLVTRVVTIDQAALLLIDLHTEEGITGRAYLFGYSALGNACLAPPLRWLVETMKGEVIAPDVTYPKARKALTLMGHDGIAMMAVSGFDMACWDALAQAADLPLVEYMGGKIEPIRAYNSCGLGIIPLEAAVEEAPQLIKEGGFEAIKVRLGRESLDDDLAVVRAVRAAVGDDIALLVDFNQGLGVDEAVRRGQALDGEGVYWIEEPVAYDDLAGYARIAREVKTPIQIGENFYGPEAAAYAIAAKACDYIMPDAERIGGVSGWLQTAALAKGAGIPMSSHIFPEISCHLMAVTPTRHWLEYVDWAAPVLESPLRLKDGHVLIPEVPGTGVSWNEDAVEKYAVDL